MLTLYFPQGDLKSQFYNDTSYVPGLSGRKAYFSQAYVELMFLFYRFLGWGICQITGGMENRWKQRGIVLPVASFSDLCDLFGSLDITVKQRYIRFAARFKGVEVQFSRIKHCIKDSLFTKRTASRKNKDTAIANLINIWNSFGKRKTMKIESLCHGRNVARTKPIEMLDSVIEKLETFVGINFVRDIVLCRKRFY